MLRLDPTGLATIHQRRVVRYVCVVRECSPREFNLGPRGIVVPKTMVKVFDAREVHFTRIRLNAGGIVERCFAQFQAHRRVVEPLEVQFHVHTAK